MGQIVDKSVVCLGGATEKELVIFSGKERLLTPPWDDDDTTYLLPEFTDKTPYELNKARRGTGISHKRKKRSSEEKEEAQLEEEDDGQESKSGHQARFDILQRDLGKAKVLQVPKGVGRRAYDSRARPGDDSEEEDCSVVRHTDDALAMKVISWTDDWMEGRMKEAGFIEDHGSSTADPTAKKKRKKVRAKRIDTNVTVKTINEDLDRLFRFEGPNGSKAAKLRQIALFDRLHTLFEARKLPPCMLSYSLKATVLVRKKLKKGLLESDGSSPQYRLLVRLAMFPPGTALLTDRGYLKFGIFYPNLNQIITPSFIEKRGQFDYEEMMRDVPIKKLRYTSEVIFSRVQQTKLLQGIIRFNDYVVFESVLSYACGMANLTLPLREPSDWQVYLNSRGTN